MLPSHTESTCVAAVKGRIYLEHSQLGPSSDEAVEMLGDEPLDARAVARGEAVAGVQHEVVHSHIP